MSSAPINSMLINHSLFDDQDQSVIMMPSQILKINNFPFHTNFAPESFLDHQSNMETKQNQEDFTADHHIRESQILSMKKSSSTNYWAWGELSDCNISMKRNIGGGDDHLGVSAIKMKKKINNNSNINNKTRTRRNVRDPRFCFKTLSDVDVLDDGYKWRKYGQKVVKNTQHPRSYYRCTQDNCRVKKRVERLAEDPRMVITTYEGRHIHSPSHDHNEEDQDISAQINDFFW